MVGSQTLIAEVPMRKVLALVAIPVACLPATARDFNLTVASGQIVVAHQYISWDRDCKNNGGVVKLVTKPQHGRAIPRHINAPIGRSYFSGSTRCTGVIADAFEVSYRSVPGFHGTDIFTILNTTGAGQTVTDSYTVNVR
jgi:hypothetical protein